jgi:DNA-binding MltR family transcriptional regulator
LAKPKLRSLIGQSPSDDEIRAVRNTFAYGTPLEAAIFSQAIIEHHLEQMLRAKFKRKNDATWARLTNDGAPLGTFSNKLIAGLAFGLYDESSFRNLNKIREIRNVFAHSKRLITFEEPTIVQALKGLSLPTKTTTRKYEALKEVSENADKNSKRAFRSLCFILYVELLDKRSRSLKATSSNIVRAKRKALAKNPFSPYEGLGSPSPYDGLGSVFRSEENRPSKKK